MFKIFEAQPVARLMRIHADKHETTRFQLLAKEPYVLEDIFVECATIVEPNDQRRIEFKFL